MAKLPTTHTAGFTAIEVVITLVVLTAIGGVGYFVWHRQHESKPIAANVATNSTPPSNSTNSSAQKDQQETLTQTYTSPQYGFSFKYPANWKLTTNLKDIGRGGPEGDIYVESPYGTKVHFGPNFGGKGGDCWDDQANARTTRTCTTRNILSVSSLLNPGPQPIWLAHTSDTAPTDQGGKTTYLIYLSTYAYDSQGKQIAPTTGSTLGAFLGTYDDVQLNKVSLTVYVDGNDDSKNGSSAFFNSKEVTEATPVLESFKAD